MSNSNNINDNTRTETTNRDPLTGAPGAHPVRTRVGALVGGPAGKGVAEVIDPTRERAYWSENFTRRAYVDQGASFDDYGPAYGFGVNARGRHPGRRFDEVEYELSGDWDTSRGASGLSWEQAKHAARDAWNRITPSR